MDNIPDWAHKQFLGFYSGLGATISKGRIFDCVYGVLNDPLFQSRYLLNMKRGFPEVPIYSEFDRWASWGHDLLHHHVGFERAEPFKFKRVDSSIKSQGGLSPRLVMKLDAQTASLEIDTQTTLTGIPKEAFRYQLGSRTAIEWVIDQYKEKKVADETDIAKLHDYRFAANKEDFIDLLGRVVSMSAGTVGILDAMRLYPDNLRLPPAASIPSILATPDGGAPLPPS